VIQPRVGQGNVGEPKREGVPTAGQKPPDDGPVVRAGAPPAIMAPEIFS